MDRRITRRRFLGLSATTAAGLFLAACGAPPAAPTQPAPTQPAAATTAAVAPAPTAIPKPTTPVDAPLSTGPVRVAAARAISALDGVGGGVQSTTAALQLYDSLTELDPKLQLRPGLAESWEIVNPTTTRFKLRQGVKFHNGEVFDANSVKFSIERLVALQPVYTYAAQWVSGWPPSVEIENPYSVLIKTPKPQPIVARLLCRVPMQPASAAGNADFFKKAIGTGPFKFVDWTPGQKLTIEANKDYYKGAPKISRIVYDTITDQSARLAAFQAGEYEYVVEIPFDRIKDVAANDKFSVSETPTIGLDFIAFNGRAVKPSPAADPKIRKALTYAIDQQAIRDSILSGKGDLLKGPAPALVIAAVDAGGFPKRDVAMAKKLLSDAGYDGTEVKFMATGNEILKELEIAEAIVAQLKEAGVTVKFEQLEGAAFTQRRPTPNWDLMTNGVPGSFTGEAQYHYLQLRTQQGWVSAKVDALLAQADDPANNAQQRLDLIQQAMKQLWDEVPYLWAIGKVTANGSVKKLKDVEFIPINWQNFRGARLEA
jgi:peptide/nickel transport system substrate-binding protein